MMFELQVVQVDVDEVVEVGQCGGQWVGLLLQQVEVGDFEDQVVGQGSFQ